MTQTTAAPSAVTAAQDWLAEHEQEMLSDLRAMLRIPSIEGEPAPNAPFGAACRAALDLALNWGKASGMSVRDVDGFAGHVEFGEGKGLVMALGHLDVVPVSDGWKHEPFGAEIDGDYIYSRGAIDDKGPSVAAFYAAKALKETGADLGCRVRVVFGCNEESGFKCVERYFQVEEAPTYGIAPDSGYPCIHAEKGIANLIVRVPRPQGALTLESLYGGQRPNIVIDKAELKLRVARELQEEAVGKIADYWDKNIETSWTGPVLTIVAKGKAAHGSRPYLGDSAVVRALRLAMELAPPSQKEQYEELLEIGHPSGVGLGIHGRDDASEDLTANIGIVRTVDADTEFTVNVRYPVTWTGADLRKKAEAFLSKKKWTLHDMSDSPPLYFPADQEPVSTICDVVRIETGDTTPPGVMGGGTYARAVPNTVSVGTGWEGDGPAHENDERIHISHPLKMARIYAHMLFRLAQLAR